MRSSSENASFRRLRIFISAALIAIREIQVESFDFPEKVLKCRKALMKHSWTTSSASWRFRVIRNARRKILSWYCS